MRRATNLFGVSLVLVVLAISTYASFVAVSPSLVHNAEGANPGSAPSKSMPSTVPSSAVRPISLSSCFGLGKSATEQISKLSIALVKPIFTTSAYWNAFYSFYNVHGSEPSDVNVTTGLNLLNATVGDQWGTSQSLYDFLSSEQAVRCGLVKGRNLQVLNDVDVTEGALFDGNGSRKFGVVILGFTEYVTSQEYAAYKKFVATGGTIIFMDSCNFLAQVQYHRHSNHISLVRGHGWAFNGKSAWRYLPYGYWHEENANWVGSNYCCYESSLRTAPAHAVANTTHPLSVALRKTFGADVFPLYQAHEENAIANSTDSIIAYMPKIKDHVIAAYSHDYRGGRVIHIGIFSDDIIKNDRSVQFFLIQSLAAHHQPYSWFLRH